MNCKSSPRQQLNKLYELLRVPVGTSDPVVLKRAYYTIALEVHPDKHPEDPRGATVAFEQLKSAFDILIDPHKRAIYETSEGIGADISFTDLQAHVGRFCARIPEDEFRDLLHQFEQTYKGSPQERADVLEHIRRNEGNATRIVDSVVLGTLEDIDRLADVVREAFRTGELPMRYAGTFESTLELAWEREKEERRLFEKAQDKEAKRKRKRSQSAPSSPHRDVSGFFSLALNSAFEDQDGQHSTTWKERDQKSNVFAAKCTLAPPDGFFSSALASAFTLPNDPLEGQNLEQVRLQQQKHRAEEVQRLHLIDGSSPSGQKRLKKAPLDLVNVSIDDFKLNMQTAVEDSQGAFKRSRRHRVPPLAFWKNERVVYTTRGEDDSMRLSAPAVDYLKLNAGDA